MEQFDVYVIALRIVYWRGPLAIARLLTLCLMSPMPMDVRSAKKCEGGTMDNDTMRLVSWKNKTFFIFILALLCALPFAWLLSADSISLVVHTSLGISASAFGALLESCGECRMCRRRFCKVNTDDFVIYRRFAHTRRGQGETCSGDTRWIFLHQKRKSRGEEKNMNSHSWAAVLTEFMNLWERSSKTKLITSLEERLLLMEWITQNVIFMGVFTIAPNTLSFAPVLPLRYIWSWTEEMSSA